MGSALPLSLSEEVPRTTTGSGSRGALPGYSAVGPQCRTDIWRACHMSLLRSPLESGAAATAWSAIDNQGVDALDPSPSD